MQRPDPIFVYGASGHGRVVIDAIERGKRYYVAFVLDDNPVAETFLTYPVYEPSRVLPAVPDGVVTIGDNRTRRHVTERLRERGRSLAICIGHPTACVARGVEIGYGSVFLAGSIVNPGTVMGHGVIINTAASVDHDCRIGDYVHIAPGAHLCGGVTVGEETLIGAGSVVIPGANIGARCVIGAGSTIIRDVPDGAKVVGVGRVLGERALKRVGWPRA